MCDEEVECAELGIPERLWIDGREPDHAFGPDERLFRWFKPNMQFFAGHISGAVGQAFRDIQHLSTNREAYCEHPTDVLYSHSSRYDGHRFDHGVLEAAVNEIEDLTYRANVDRQGREIDERREFTFSVRHDPVECMYPHSVIELYESGELIESKPKPKPVRAIIRSMIAETMRVCHEPDPDFDQMEDA